MIYKLNDSVQIKKSSEQVLVFNDKVEILLEGLSCRTFNDLISSKDEAFIIAQVQKELMLIILKRKRNLILFYTLLSIITS